MVVRVIAIKALLLIAFYLYGITAAATVPVDDPRIVQLDDDYQQLVAEVYQAQAVPISAIDDLEKTASRVPAIFIAATKSAR